MDTRKLDLNLLVTLEALLAARSVTRAAERLNLSQPAVSTQLNRLRKLFDDPLLIPVQRGMTPTARALELREPLRQALDGVRGVVGKHRAFDARAAQLRVNIACTDYVQAVCLVPLVQRLRQQAPGIQLAIRHLAPAQLDAQMVEGAVDMALMTPAAAPPGLRSRHLFDEHYVLIGRRRHPGLKTGLTPAQFARLDQVIVSPVGGGFSTALDEGLNARGLRRNVVLSAASFLTVLDIVAGSDLVALVPSRLVANRRDTLKVMPCPFPVPGFAVGLLWHERTHNHRGHRWVREAIIALADTMQTSFAGTSS